MDLGRRSSAKRQKVSENILLDDDNDVILSTSENSNEIIIRACKEEPATYRSNSPYELIKVENDSQSDISNGKIIRMKAETSGGMNVFHMYSSNEEQEIDVRSKEESRRVLHNEIERRRRDKINAWITKLNNLIPADLEIFDKETNQVYDSNSKGGILAKACEYISQLQETGRKTAQDNESLVQENAALKQQIRELKADRCRLKLSDRASVITVPKRDSSSNFSL